MGYVIIIVFILFVFWRYMKKRNELNRVRKTQDTLDRLASIAVKENCLAVFQIKPIYHYGIIKVKPRLMCWINYKLISRIILGWDVFKGMAYNPDINPNINLRKNINKDYIKIYTIDNEKTIAEKIKNLDDGLKIYIRWMIKPIFHKESFLYEKKGVAGNWDQVHYPTKFDGANSLSFLFMSKEESEANMKAFGMEGLKTATTHPSKKFINTAIDNYFDDIKVSPSFFESSDDGFLKKIN